MADVISALHRHDGKLAAQEQKVASFVKDNLDSVSSMTIGDLAQSCGVSKPTVIRFCRSLGCDGFREFKLRLAQNLAVSAQYLYAASETGTLSSHSALDQVIGGLFETVNAMRAQVDFDALDAAKLAILGTRQILFAGIGGGSSTVAQEGANRFFRLGFPAFCVSDSYILQMRAATFGPGDVWVSVSTSGEADAIVGAAKIARSYGATTISITPPGTRLGAVSDILIRAELPENRDIFKPTASRYAHLILVDALAMAVAQDMSGETIENLRRIRASLTAYHGRTGPQPLGD